MEEEKSDGGSMKVRQSRNDSRQSGSVMVEDWLRLQPELPQYTQYNVLLCSSGCRSSSHLQPGPFLPGGPQSGQKHTPKNNTVCHRGTQSAWVKRHSVAHEMRSGKYETRQGRKTVSQGAQVLFLYILSFSAHSSGLFIHKCSQMAAVL